MKHSERVEVFEKVRARYGRFLTSVLWKLTGDRELFSEAMQYALLGIWQNIEKLGGEKAAAYIYRIALTANSKAWRNRVGRDGQINQDQVRIAADCTTQAGDSELLQKVRRVIAKLPAKQAGAVVMRYFEQQDYGAIAVKLECTEVSARSNVSKALSALRKRLQGLIEGGF